MSNIDSPQGQVEGIVAKEKMTKAKKYRKMWSSLFGAPQAQLNDRWSAAVNKYGGLTLRCDKMSRCSLDEASTLKLIEFLQDAFVKEIK